MKPNSRMKRFIKDILKYTPFLKIISLLVVLWLLFSAGLFFSERGIWIVLGSALFFGTIVATITTYFMRPLHRPGKQFTAVLISYNNLTPRRC